MQLPIEITFRDMRSSPALIASIEAWARKLDDVFTLQRCAVVIEKPHKHLRHGAPFLVHLDITIPGHEVAVSHGSHSQRDPYLAVSDAFRAARRQLLDFTTSRREARPAV
jgi:hypothetical protein